MASTDEILRKWGYKPEDGWVLGAPEKNIKNGPPAFTGGPPTQAWDGTYTATVSNPKLKLNDSVEFRNTSGATGDAIPDPNGWIDTKPPTNLTTAQSGGTPKTNSVVAGGVIYEPDENNPNGPWIPKSPPDPSNVSNPDKD